MKTTKITWAEYNRRSSEEGSNKQNVSIERQKQELEDKFPESKFKRSWHEEESHSAYKPNQRPKFNELVELIEAGKITGLIVFHPNRLSRNPTEAGQITQLIADGKLKDLKFASYTFDNSPEGILLLQFALSQSHYESSKLSAHVHSGNKYRFFEKRRWSGQAKQGFLNYIDPLTRERDIVPCPKRFPMLKDTIQRLLGGEFTPREALDYLNNDLGYRTVKRKTLGGGLLSETTWYKMLHDPFYHGSMERKVMGEMESIKHDYPILMTEKQFQVLQVRLGGKSRSRQKNHNFAFKDVLGCGECGGSITAEEKWQVICPECKTKFSKTAKRVKCTHCNLEIKEMRDPTILHYVYYHCTKKVNKHCSQGSIRLEDLEKTVNEELQRFEIHPKFKDWMLNHLEELNEVEAKQDEESTERNTKNYEDLKSRMRRLTKVRFGEEFEHYSDEESEAYEQLLEDTKKEIGTVKKHIDNTDTNQENWIDFSRKYFEFATYARHWFTEGTSTEKTQVLGALGSNLKILDGKLLIDGQKPFYLIEKAKKEAEILGVSLEPKKITDVEDIFPYLQPVIPTLLRD
ncbi:MAG: recombinase family protein [Candidatus Pacebacteria bacterium]|jgi:site-specific DNA recombinase|nr:recombinase family protein [Candidatus Paceibacterota bacterium]